MGSCLSRITPLTVYTQSKPLATRQTASVFTPKFCASSSLVASLPLMNGVSQTHMTRTTQTISSSKAIEEGDGLPDMCHTSKCPEALSKSGFDVLEARDAALDGHEGGDPWYRPLTPSWAPWKWPRFQFNPVMYKLFPYLLKALECVHIVPAGTAKTQCMLQYGGIGCERGVATGTFTPMWLMVAKKPTKAKAN